MTDSSLVRGKQWLETLLSLLGLSADVKADVEEPFEESSDERERNSYWLTINEEKLSPDQIQTLIGPEGTVLDAVQYLANATLNLSQTQEEQASYTIELNGYRVRRQAEVRAIASSAAMQVRESGEEVEIKSLSSAERRQVHTFLKSFEDLETFSRGKEPHRHLVVRTKLSARLEM